MGRGPMLGARKFLGGLGKELDVRGPWVQKSNEGRSINNLFTGYEAGSRTKGVGAIAALGYGGYHFATGSDREAKSAASPQSEYNDIESLPGTRGDMQGYSANVGNAMNQLQTSGDLVFALHKIRNGG